MIMTHASMKDVRYTISLELPKSNSSLWGWNFPQLSLACSLSLSRFEYIECVVGKTTIGISFRLCLFRACACIKLMVSHSHYTLATKYIPNRYVSQHSNKHHFHSVTLICMQALLIKHQRHQIRWKWFGFCLWAKRLLLLTTHINKCHYFMLFCGIKFYSVFDVDVLNIFSLGHIISSFHFISKVAIAFTFDRKRWYL